MNLKRMNPLKAMKKIAAIVMVTLLILTSNLIVPKNAFAAESLKYVSNDGWWASNTGSFDANKITNRVASGDFNGDGKKDTAAFFDLGNSSTKMFVWLSTGSSFTHTDSFDWTSGSGAFDATKIKGVVSGNFNGDRYSDIALFYDLGNNTTKLYVWISNGSSFTHMDSFDWTSGSGSFNANNITGVVAGNFTGTSLTDIALFYNSGNSTSKIMVFKATGSSFTHADSYDWTSGTGSFNANNVKAIIAGNFQGKDKPAGIAAFYDLGNSTTKMFVWLPTSGKFTHTDSYDWTSGSGSFDANKIAGRAVAGDFTGDGKSDIGVFYDLGNTTTKMMVFQSTGSAFTHNDSFDWLTGNSYDANKLTGRVIAGDFNGIGSDSIAGFYDYGNSTTKIHVWLSSNVGMTPGPVDNKYYNYEVGLIVNITSINSKFNTQLANFKNIYESHKSTYINISNATGIPPELIAAIHYRESTCDFNTYLQNGDPLGQPTTHVPVGIYYDNFTDAAIAAMLDEASLRDSLKLSSTSNNIAAMCAFAELYNGLGYYNRGTVSPYVYSGTNIYTSGKFIKDNEYDSSVVDAQPGVYILINELRN